MCGLCSKSSFLIALSPLKEPTSIIDVLTIDDADKLCAENGYPDTNVCNSNPYIL